MSQSVQWQKQQQTLVLSGVLDRNTLNTIWQETDIAQNMQSIDVSALTRVDSAGLALLAYYCTHHDIALRGVSSQLSTLIELYNLSTVIKVQ
ncbi:STAS domain-containing protein [Zophobihabitans entericus]|uniref:STAS domain-containing protein n=2 Tax=Zophobihabitans entericus TaxID=1635327 RepID=A0A6G9IF95_9GAMM|nr:STAS domain-containing protein [Zophobihabitans entericus]